MSNKSEPNPHAQKSQQQVASSQSSVLISPGFQDKQNHLSSSFENLLKYEEQNFEIEFLTKSTSVPKTVIQNEMKLPLTPSSLKGEQIFQKYGSLIQNQPLFLKEIIFHNYLQILPEKFQKEFSQIILMGSSFEAVWWGSLVISLIQAYRHRNSDLSFREKGTQVLAYGFMFLASSLGFHEHYYIPKLKNCYFNNIKSIDSMMDRHVKILKSCGATFEERTFAEYTEIIKPQNGELTQSTSQIQKPNQFNPKANPSPSEKKQNK